MKKFVLALAFFLAASLSFGQDVVGGKVNGVQVLTNPVNNAVVYDFEVCCGNLSPAPGGITVGNTFSITNGALALSFQGYSVSGTLNTWNSEQPIDGTCSMQSATFQNVSITLGTNTLGTNFVAEYSQFVCDRESVFWLGPGGFSVHQL